MKRIKVKIVGDGSETNPHRVTLPNYTMDCKRDANGTPIWTNYQNGQAEHSIDYVNKECYVLVPDDETKEIQGKSKLDQSKIRKKYKGWSKFKASDVEL